MNRDHLLATLAADILAVRLDHPVRVAIAGITAAGKTTLADELAVRLASSGRPVHRCSYDDFHPKGYKWRSIREEWTPELYWAEGYDNDAFRQFVLDPLAPGGDRRCRLALFSSFHDEFLPEVWTTLEHDAILLVDGAMLLRPELRDCWDYAAWLEIDTEEVIRRAVVRDAAWASDPSRIEHRYRSYHLPAHDIYLATGARDFANIRIDNTNPEAPVLLD